MALFVCVPPALTPIAEALGFVIAPSQNALPADPAFVRRAWAQGTREAICEVRSAQELWALRPLALFAAAFGEPLRSGTLHTKLRAYGGLVASEWRTGQEGSLLFVHNPAETPLNGSVFPAFEERVLAPGETVIWAHDFPLGRSENYLGAYAGLVKSDATLLTAHLRPDPFPGARIFVLGKPGERHEVTLFNAGPGEAVEVVFGESPAVFPVGVSQVVTVPESLASQLWLVEETTWLGPHWELTHIGEVHAHTNLKTAIIGGDSEPRSAQLIFEGEAPESVWLNGVPIFCQDITLLPGENLLCVRGEHGPAFIIPDGGCFQVALTEWHTQSSQ
jgi:hypothetical protein